MSKPTLPKINPEIDEDLMAAWLNIDTEYRITKAQKYRIYKQKYYQLYPTFFMSLHTNYLNFVHFVTKNAIAATAICLIALTAVSASAAQLVAPVEYRPSTIASNFFANKQVDKNPYTALKPDGNNDVVSMDKCDLSVKYPKNADNKNLFFTSFGDNIKSNMKEADIPTPSLLDISMPKDDLDLDNLPEENTFYSPNSFYLSFENEQKNINNTGLNILCGTRDEVKIKLQNNNREFTNTTKEELLKKYGWFVTQSNLENIRESLVGFGTDQQKNSYSEAMIIFEYAGKTFILTNSLVNNKPTVNFNQIQFQFNSLVKNEANKEIVVKSENVASLANSSSFSSSQQTSKPAIPDLKGTKFVGKIGNNEIEMYLTDLDMSGDKMGQKVGYYTYGSQSKSIGIRQINARTGGSFAVLEEFVDNQKTGTFTVDSFDKNLMKGTWLNEATKIIENFEVRRTGENSQDNSQKNISKKYTGNTKTINNLRLSLTNDGLGGFYGLSTIGNCPSQECQVYYAFKPVSDKIAKLNVKMNFEKADSGVFYEEKQDKIKISAKAREFIDGTNSKIWEITEISNAEVATTEINNSQNNSKEI
jgi:hypothetical protein